MVLIAKAFRKSRSVIWYLESQKWEHGLETATYTEIKQVCWNEKNCWQASYLSFFPPLRLRPGLRRRVRRHIYCRRKERCWLFQPKSPMSRPTDSTGPLLSHSPWGHWRSWDGVGTGIQARVGLPEKATDEAWMSKRNLGTNASL